MAQNSGKFTTGATMRHVVVMTLTGSFGLMFMFLVDAAALFWVSQIGVAKLVAAMGFAWTIQFVTISVAIGLMIATTALVSRSLGAGARDEARRQTSSAILIATATQSLVAVAVYAFRHEILYLTGAEGETHAIAAGFLALSVPSLPLIALSMACAATLRAMGDALRSMYVTLSAGLVAVFLDPFLIVTLGWGVDGAAIAIVISRGVSAAVGMWLLIRVHDMVARPDLTHARRFAAPFFAVAGPSVLTQLSTPFGNYLVTYYVSGFGDSAVAGWAVIGRIMVLAFGGIFALSGAIGGIIGQNYGARKPDRIASAYRDSAVFCLAYVAVVWLILALSAQWIAGMFNLSGQGEIVAVAFLRYVAGSFVFVGALFVANAAFNNLGRPLWSTGFNWLRDGILIAPLALLFADWFAAPGVLYGQAAAGVIAGSLAYWVGWRFIRGLRLPDEAPELHATRVR